MNLILWRHAEAEEGSDDLSRRLTEKGHAQAQATAQWLQTYLPENTQVWVSQAARSQQTAAALGRPYTVVPALNPINQVKELPVLLQATRPDDCLVWVGHQPWIGQLCSYLLNEEWLAGQYWSVKKSGLWWFKLRFVADGHPHAKLKAAMTPQLLLPDDEV